MVQLTKNQYFDGLVQERRNSIANTLELRLSCTIPSICSRNGLVLNRRYAITRINVDSVLRHLLIDLQVSVASRIITATQDYPLSFVSDGSADNNQYFDGLVQEKLNSIANTLELRISCTIPSICSSNGCQLDERMLPWWPSAKYYGTMLIIFSFLFQISFICF